MPIDRISEGLINSDEIQLLQADLSKITGATICCLDVEFNQMTELTGPSWAVELIGERDGIAKASFLNERVEEGSLEDVAVEYVDEIGETAIIAVRLDGATLFYMLVFNSLEKEKEESFIDVIDLLRDGANTMYSIRLSGGAIEGADVIEHVSSEEQEKMRYALKVSETNAQILQLLDSTLQIEQLMQKWLEITASFLEVDSAQIVQVDKNLNVGELRGEYLRQGEITHFTDGVAIKTDSRLVGDRPVILSDETDVGDELELLNHLNLKAFVSYPVSLGNTGDKMVVIFNIRHRSHSWSQDELKFISDAMTVLKSIITKRIQRNSLLSSYSTLQEILDNVGCYVFVVSKTTDSVLVTNKLLKTFFSDDLKSGELRRCIAEAVATDKDNVGRAEMYYKPQNRWYDLTYREVSWVDMDRVIVYALFDITDKKDYQRRIEQQAFTDFLTGLYNRMCCERDFSIYLDEAKINNETGALMYLDLDDFKHINDGLGHQYGDELLKNISTAISSIRGLEKTCYRMGGDEFVIVVRPEVYPELERIKEDISAIFNRPWYLKDGDYYCTMSMGIVEFPYGTDDVKEIIKKADIAMYEAKKSGKNRIAMYSSDESAASGRRLEMEKNMRNGASNDYSEFEVYYQPIIDITGEKPECAGAEALVRWNSSKLGFISPADFIPLAEYLGLINPIGNHVLKVACRRLKEWNKVKPHMKVNVNLSVVQLLQNNIVEIVADVLAETGINPKNLTLEVTESLAINDMERMKKILDRIKDMGIHIALDDFGTGYSSLNHIREIPLDYIKVDQSFVKDLASDAYSQSFVRMVSELANTIGVEVCVEGIETTRQYSALDNMGIKFIQGYFFDRPLPTDQFEGKYVNN